MAFAIFVLSPYMIVSQLEKLLISLSPSQGGQQLCSCSSSCDFPLCKMCSIPSLLHISKARWTMHPQLS